MDRLHKLKVVITIPAIKVMPGIIWVSYFVINTDLEDCYNDFAINALKGIAEHKQQECIKPESGLIFRAIFKIFLLWQKRFCFEFCYKNITTFTIQFDYLAITH